MKAIVCTKFGLDNLKLEEIQKPTPGDNEVLVEVYAASVNTSNLAGVSGKPFLARLFGAAADALRYYGEGHTRGKIAIIVNHKNGTLAAQS